MDHVDPDVLALAALGERVDPADEAHLAVCERCGDELAALTRTADLARAGVVEQLVAPPPRVWARIEGELGLAAGTPRPVVPAPATAAPRPAEPGASTGAREPGTPAGTVATVVPLRRRVPVWVAAAAAAGVVVGGVGATWLADRDGGGPASVVAAANLEALPGWAASGHAAVEEAADGTRVLVLDVAVGDVDGLREVWLLREDVSGLVSLGLLDGEEGRFVLPAGIDLAEYPVVDVSREPLDGDPAHSGDSIVRGLLGGGAVDA